MRIRCALDTAETGRVRPSLTRLVKRSGFSRPVNSADGLVLMNQGPVTNPEKIRIIFTALTEKVCGKIIYTSLIYSATDDSS